MVLYQPIDGYCYNSDTHFLFNFIKENLKTFKNIQGEILDIGSGSGVLGLLLKNEYQKLVLSSLEPQKSFQFLTQKNAAVNKLETNLIKGKLQEITHNKKYDYIVSNPPFYPSSVVQSVNENIKIARYNDNLPLDEFIQKTSQLLHEKGKFFFCYDGKLLDEIIIHMKRYKINIEAIQFLHPKLSKNATLVMVYGRKNSKSHMKILPPLIMFDENGTMLENINKIYEMCNTYSIKAKI
jgi:tRNA1(Val) A37 N6-methylase TrmN6